MMENSKQVIRSIVIVGGGTSGWMTAAALSHFFKGKPVKLTLVESSTIGTIGVGEATIPTLRRFYNKLGFSDFDVIKATNATCKLGIEFKDWKQKGSRFIHPFGLFGQGTKEVDFHHYWNRARLAGEAELLSEYSLGASLALHNKFVLPSTPPSSQLDIFDWALHFDAALFANLMKEFALSHGVMLKDNVVEKVNVAQSTGNIASVTLDSGEQVEGDLFVDCSGFKSLLLQETLKTGYQNWSDYLVCDRAVAVQTQARENPVVRTISQAQESGWTWKIPLQHRTGNGHVYSSQFISDDEATSTLVTQLDGEMLHAPRMFSFTPGRAEKAWNKNCIAVGLSSGFLEPLESTSIALVETAIEKILLSVKDASYTEQVRDRFNQVTALEYERVRDFIILHYKLTHRTDSAMWRYCQQMAIPDELASKMQAFSRDGSIKSYPWEIFGKDSWLAIYDGFDFRPESFNPKALNMELGYLKKHLSFMKSSIGNAVESAPTHAEFLAQVAADGM
ncbi:tryptophan halogenase family protein [Shewanella nanhaiensis]|uniref:Tryptophan 7-halogenase n=1 Tax=Shewanella nanhaiensis TaxID=2864872 RepID=A0ABS7E2Y2_9GAMM|nr:tryptophan halogenase family protein [Shewanella nanhaiensis]MBW8184041.1 tryptophan 7-halogenase [Shewanella nanhaiensis]